MKLFDFLKRKKSVEKSSQVIPLKLKYPNEDSPWLIQEYIFQDNLRGYKVWVLRVDSGHNGYDMINAYWNGTTRLIFNISSRELENIIRNNYDSWENNLAGLMFSNLSEAQRFINDYNYCYDTFYLMNVLTK